MRYAPFAAGEVMTRQGAVAHWLYILTAGKADVRVCIDHAPPKTIATITAPGFFGEMGLMTGEPRANDVIAITDVECYRLDKDGFQKILLARPEIADEMSHTLAKRRVELIAARDNLDEAAMSSRQVSEQERILRRIKEFFGLSA
jgi:CRP-like cAMP-binding protein